MNKQLILEKSQNYKNWNQRYQNKFNNINNVKFLNNGNYKKLSKISNIKINKNILFIK